MASFLLPAGRPGGRRPPDWRSWPSRGLESELSEPAGDPDLDLVVLDIFECAEVALGDLECVGRPEAAMELSMKGVEG